jgi:sugar phosphate isomerase/epimerase
LGFASLYPSYELDVYHIWWDAELMSEIARAGKNRLLAFHVFDWRSRPRTSAMIAIRWATA